MISQVSANSSYNIQKPNAFSSFNLTQSTYYQPVQSAAAEDKEQHSHKLGITIATSAVLLGFGVLAIMKGLPKGFTKKIENLKSVLEQRLDKFSDEAKSSKLANFYKYLFGKTEKAAEYLNSINNACSFKDILFAKLMNKTKLTGKIAKKITGMFERFSRKTVINGYSNARGRFERLYEVFGAADNKIIAANPEKVVTIDGKTLTAKEWLKVINDKKLNMSQIFNSYFGKKAVQGRYKETKEVMSGLEDKVWDLSFGNVKDNIKNKELYDTFLPEAILQKDKSLLQKKVNWYKNIITGNAEREGHLDEIMKIYKELLSPEDFQKMERTAMAARTKLDRAVLLETDKFFDKLRDLQLGSAPTDFLSMVAGLATVGAGLTKAEDNDERISVSLKYGIPALSAIATSLYLGATLVSGGNALILSTLSGMLINKAGTEIDEYRKKHFQPKSENNTKAV